MPLHTAWLGGIYQLLGRYDEAIAEAQKAMAIDPNFPVSHFILALVHEDRGMYEEALPNTGRRQRSLPLEMGARHGLCQGWRLDEARKILAELEQHRVTPWNALWRARLNLALADKDETFRWLNYESPHAGSPGSGSSRTSSPCTATRASRVCCAG